MFTRPHAERLDAAVSRISRSPQYLGRTMPTTMDTSYLTTQVTTIIDQLHSIFDEIGVPRTERDARETEVRPKLTAFDIPD